MKKILSGLIVASSFFAAGAFAAVENVSSTPVTDAECALLPAGASVRLNMSNNVHGAFNCVVADNSIRVAACHLAGSRKETTAKCEAVGEGFNDPSCKDTTGTFTVKDYRAYTASTTGGSVAMAAMGGLCSDTTVGAVGALTPK